MLVIILDLFLAGAETTSTSLKWAVLFMTLNQEVQDKCREEITNVVGSRQPNLADMAKLVYCQATILEIQRLSCTVPSSLNHRVMEDTNIEGFLFPKDSIVIANFYYMMKSPAFWDEPSVFKPYYALCEEFRFLVTDPVTNLTNQLTVSTELQGKCRLCILFSRRS